MNYAYMNNYFIILAFACVLISCSNSNQSEKGETNYSEIEKASWLIGEWQSNSAKGNASEVWEKKNDSIYAGKSYFIKGTDTVSSEKISLEQKGNQLFYIPIVQGQNAGQPVRFTLTSSENHQLIFENPSHDFPQKISYTQVTGDSLLAEVSGTTEGKINSQQFPMTRVR